MKFRDGSSVLSIHVTTVEDGKVHCIRMSSCYNKLCIISPYLTKYNVIFHVKLAARQ